MTKGNRALLSTCPKSVASEAPHADPASAYSIERAVREAIAIQDHDKISRIVDQLCQEFAYAVHQTHARNGGLIGLAAVSIALGSVHIVKALKKRQAD